MKKKVIGLCILLLVLLLGLSTVCYAATGPAIKVEGLGTTTKEEIFEILYEKFFGVDINTLPAYQQTYINNSKTKFSSDSTYSVFAYSISSGYNFVFYFTGNTIGNTNNYSNGITIRNQSTMLQIMLSNPPSISYQNSNYNYGLENNSPYFLFQNPNDDYAWYEYSSVGWSIADELRPSFNFVPTDSIGTITLPHDNGSDTAYCIKPNNIFAPGVDGFIELGQVTTYSNFNDLNVYCVVYDRVVSGETMSGSVVGSSYYYLDNNGKLYFNPIKLYETLLYQFLFRETDTNNNISLVGSEYFYVGYPSNNPIFGSGDFSWSNPQIFVEGLIGTPGGGRWPWFW